jgi:hypothetical protein
MLQAGTDFVYLRRHLFEQLWTNTQVINISTRDTCWESLARSLTKETPCSRL